MAVLIASKFLFNNRYKNESITDVISSVIVAMNDYVCINNCVTAKYINFIFIIYYMSIVKEKNQKWHAEIVSAEKRKFFEETRKRILEAQKS